MTSTTTFTNDEGIELTLRVPFGNYPWWVKQVMAWEHVLECFGFYIKK